MKLLLPLAAILIAAGHARSAWFEKWVLPELPPLQALSFQTFQLPIPREPISYTFDGAIYRYFSYYTPPGQGVDLMSALFVKTNHGVVRILREYHSTSPLPSPFTPEEALP